jgi:hypothetical protein
MQKNKLIKLTMAVVTAVSLYACDKGAENEVEGQGDNIFRLKTTEEIMPVLFTADPVLQTGEVAEVRRDANSSDELTKTASLKLVADNSLIADYNTAHGETLELLPNGSYTIDPLDMNFGSGEFVKSLQIKLNPSTIDLSKKYALAFRIGEASNGYMISEENRKGLYRILITNKYHGSYKSTGYFEHPTAPRAIDKDKVLSTTGPATVETEFGDLGTSGWKMRLTVNPDNTISMTPTGASNTTAQLMYDNPTYNNKYDPATQTYWVKYGYPFPGPTRIITEKITMK